MANATLFSSGTGFAEYDPLDGDIFGTPTSSRIEVLNSDGTFSVYTGTGFGFDGNGDPTGGTVTKIEHFSDGTFSLLLGEITDFSASLVTLVGYIDAEDDDGFFGEVLNNNDLLQNFDDDSQELDGYDGDDEILSLSAGNDFILGNAGDDRLDGGAGFDFLSYFSEVDYGGSGGVTVRLFGGHATDSFGDTDAVFNFESMEGTDSNDVLYGTVGDDTLGGNAGDDQIFGGPGGYDTFRGAGSFGIGVGNDTYIGPSILDESNDGGAVDYRSASAAITVVLQGARVTDPNNLPGTASSVTGDASVGTDTLYNIQYILGTAYDDVFTVNGSFESGYSNGGEEYNSFRPGAGNDTITGNGSTRLDYREMGIDITVDIDAGTATSTNPGDVAAIGTDTFSGVNQVRGGSGNDTLTGSSADGESFRGRQGNDTINGGSGDHDRADYTDAGGNIDISLAAGGGSDGFGGTDTLLNIDDVRGGGGNDSIEGNSGANKLLGMDGNDNIRGLAGNDELYGGAGFDTLDYSADQSYGGSQGVTVNLATGTATDGFNNTDSVEGFEAVVGTSFGDTLTGDGNDIEFYGGAGADIITGGAGSFTWVRAGAGDDQIIGAVPVDDEDGTQADYRDATTSGITVTLQGAVNTSLSTVVGDASIGTDTLTNVQYITGTSFADNFTAMGTFESGYGTGDGYNSFRPGAGNDTITGNGQTRLDYRDMSIDITVDFGAGTATSTNGGDLAAIGNDTFSGVNQVRGGSGDDTLTGSSADGESFRGRAGNDDIDGGGGNNDRADYRDSSGSVFVDLANNTASDGFGGTDTLTDIDDARGGTNDDQLLGDANANVLDGHWGNDFLRGLGGADTLKGGTGDDTADYSQDAANGGGGAINVDLDAGTATDGFGQTDTLSSIESIRGTANGDTIAGDEHDNTFFGLAGADIMSGGSGGFDVFRGGAGDDTITGTSRGLFDDGAQADYSDATTTGITVNLTGAAGTSLSTVSGDASIGTDTLTNVAFITGTQFDDSYTVTGTFTSTYGDGYNSFRPGAGNDSITGNGSTRLDYRNASAAIDADISTGQVTARFASEALAIGTDTFSGVQQLRGSNFDDILTGSTAGGESFRGEAGVDIIDGGGGANDRADYLGAASGVVVDLLWGWAVDGYGTTDWLIDIDDVRGSDNEDELIGDNTANILSGMSGSDRLVGNDGDDTLIGGAGNDSIIGGAGTGDTVDYSTDADKFDEDDDRGNNGVIVNLLAGTATDGFGDNDSLSGIENIIGSDFIDGLTGDGNDNRIEGRGGNDTLDGGAGADTLIGGAGDDTYILDNAGDTVTENASEGTDQVNSLVSHTVGDNVENLSLLGSGDIDAIGNALANILIGNSGNNTLNGQGGIDTMVGGAGNDIYVVDDSSDIVSEASGEGDDTVNSFVNFALFANLENLSLLGSGDNNAIGNSEDNTLIGNSGNNTIDGLTGADTMVGGDGNDIFVVDDAGDTVADNPGAGGGIDQVNSYVTFFLVSNIENLSLLGSGDLTGVGNSDDNTLIGNSGNNILDGQSGADNMIGGDGNDTFVVDNVGDTVSDNPGAGGGIDQVNSSVSFSLVANIENLSLLGSDNLNAIGNSEDNVLIGNAGDNIIDGQGGADTMIGNAGNDTFVVDNVGDTVADLASGGGIDQVNSSVSFSLVDNIENLSLIGTDNINAIGNGLDNNLFGNSGNNILDGQGGADLMVGGDGDDIYVVDNVGDSVSDNAGPSGGIDQVNSSVSFTLFANLEHLSLLGSTNIDATGNELDNNLFGNAGDNVITGLAGDDLMIGNGGNDTFVVADGSDNDTIQGFVAGSGTDDVINVAAFGFASLAEIQAVTNDDGFGNTVIQLDADDSITLTGVLESQLHEDDFIFV